RLRPRSRRLGRRGGTGRAPLRLAALALALLCAQGGVALLAVLAAHLAADVLQPLGRALLALPLVEHGLLLAQPLQRPAALALGLVDTRRDDEALAACMLALGVR